MDAVTKFPPRSPIARAALLSHRNFSFEYSTETPACVHHVSFITNDHLSSLDRTCSDLALRKNIPDQDQ